MTASRARNRLGMILSVLRSPWEVTTLMRMLPWAAALPLLKRILPLPRLVGFAASSPRNGRRRAGREQRVVELTRLLYRSRAVVGRDNCLERSLLAYRFLTKLDARPELVVGMRRGADEMLGHVWVLLEGEPVHEAPKLLADFVPVLVFDHKGGASRSAPGLAAGPPPRA